MVIMELESLRREYQTWLRRLEITGEELTRLEVALYYERLEVRESSMGSKVRVEVEEEGDPKVSDWILSRVITTEEVLEEEKVKLVGYQCQLLLLILREELTNAIRPDRYTNLLIKLSAVYTSEAKSFFLTTHIATFLMDSLEDRSLTELAQCWLLDRLCRPFTHPTLPGHTNLQTDLLQHQLSHSLQKLYFTTFAPHSPVRHHCRTLAKLLHLPEIYLDSPSHHLHLATTQLESIFLSLEEGRLDPMEAGDKLAELLTTAYSRDHYDPLVSLLKDRLDPSSLHLPLPPLPTGEEENTEDNHQREFIDSILLLQYHLQNTATLPTPLP